MKNQIPPLSPALRELAEQHFVLLESVNVAKKRDVLQLNLSGYSDVLFLIADLVKVSLLALEADGNSSKIPEPTTNISGVLSIILDLLPYEEAGLLDKIREAVLQTEDAVEAEDDFMVENLFLTMPVGLMD
jgi:hypothetical protein